MRNARLVAQVRYWNSSAQPLTGGHHPGWVSFTYWPSDMAAVPGINLAPGYGIPLAVVPWSSEEGAPQMPEWDFVAMGQVGLTGWARAAAHPVARWIARRTGRPEAENLSLIGAAFPEGSPNETPQVRHPNVCDLADCASSGEPPSDARLS